MLVSLLFILTACTDRQAHQYRNITVEAFSDMKAPAFVFDYPAISAQLRQMAAADASVTPSDRCLRKYYGSEFNRLLWIDRAGVDDRADTLLSWLRQVGAMGMTPQAFDVDDIEHDLKRMRLLDFGQETVSQVAARLEYRLSKACLRYAYGQRYGFVNPRTLFNHLDVEKEDTVRHITLYRGLFDYEMELPAQDYYQQVLRKVAADSLASFLTEIQPRDAFYLQLQQQLQKAETQEQRTRLLANMERRRWRLTRPIDEHAKRIVVNIPAYHLYAYGQDSVLDMRVVCGAVTTKTPLLTSDVEWMEVKPEWVIPMSIVQKDVVRHVGDTAYFARNHYYIYDKETRQTMTVGQMSRSMLLSGRYRVAQESGRHNSLGQLVFRFKNNHSVFLHYTSNPSAFQRESRAISHGCVRVARPFELAQFVLDNPDEWLLDRIRISMDMKPETDRGRDYLRRHQEDDKHKLIGYVPVKPHVPLHIVYYTIWPDQTGEMKTWPDVYGYDQIIFTQLKPFIGN